MIIDPMSNKPIFIGENWTVFEVANSDAFKILENILYQNYKEGNVYEFIKYQEDIVQRLSQIPIGLQPREEVVKTCFGNS